MKLTSNLEAIYNGVTMLISPVIEAAKGARQEPE